MRVDCPGPIPPVSACSALQEVPAPSNTECPLAMRLLLVYPRAPESFWTFRWAAHAILPRKRAVNPPLGLATLAALCPPHWQITIVDENVEPLPLRGVYDF